MSMPLFALVDSGADDNFINRSLVEQMGNDRLLLSTPIKA